MQDFIETTVHLDTNLSQYERDGGDRAFVAIVSKSLKIDSSRMTIVDKRQGSVILTIRLTTDQSMGNEDLKNELNAVLKSDIQYPVLAIYDGLRN